MHISVCLSMNSSVPIGYKTFVCVCVCMHAWMYVCMHLCVCVCPGFLDPAFFGWIPLDAIVLNVSVVRACMCVCIHIHHTHTHVMMHTFMHVYVYTFLIAYLDHFIPNWRQRRALRRSLTNPYTIHYEDDIGIW